MNIQGATGVLYNITGGSNLTLIETSEAAEIIRAAVDEDAEIIYGTSIDESLGDAVRITLIATGFDQRGDFFDSVDRRAGARAAPDARAGTANYRPAACSANLDAPPQRSPRCRTEHVTSHILPEDDWVAESSIIRFLRER